jgi:hypothetical protein
MDLERELLEIQSRLGTPTERPNDLERARTVAHDIANMMFVALLSDGVAAGQNRAGDCSRAPFSPALSEDACFGNRGLRDPMTVACG